MRLQLLTPAASCRSLRGSPHRVRPLPAMSDRVLTTIDEEPTPISPSPRSNPHLPIFDRVLAMLDEEHDAVEAPPPPSLPLARTISSTEARQCSHHLSFGARPEEQDHLELLFSPEASQRSRRARLSPGTPPSFQQRWQPPRPHQPPRPPTAQPRPACHSCSDPNYSDSEPGAASLAGDSASYRGSGLGVVTVQRTAWARRINTQSHPSSRDGDRGRGERSFAVSKSAAATDS